MKDRITSLGVADSCLQLKTTGTQHLHSVFSRVLPREHGNEKQSEDVESPWALESNVQGVESQLCKSLTLSGPQFSSLQNDFAALALLHGIVEGVTKTEGRKEYKHGSPSTVPGTPGVPPRC